MSTRRLVAGFILLFVCLSAAARETVIELTQGKPGQDVFVIAAKRALLSRHYETWMIGTGVVIGKYKGKIEVALILTDDSVVIRFTDHGGAKAETIDKYLRNLRRDLVYELAEFAIAPTKPSDPAIIGSLIASAKTVKKNKPDFDLTGTYSSEENGKVGEIVTLTQSGNQITGTFGASGKIWGEIEGDSVTFDLVRTGGNSGVGEWKIVNNGSELRGAWTTSNRNYSGSWNLTRIK